MPLDASKSEAASATGVFLVPGKQRASVTRLSSVPTDGDPVPDVGGAPVLHGEAVLVALLGHLGALLSRHSFCHLQGNPKTSGTDDTQVSGSVSGKCPWPEGSITKSPLVFPCRKPRPQTLQFALFSQCSTSGFYSGCELPCWKLPVELPPSDPCLVRAGGGQAGPRDAAGHLAVSPSAFLA